MQPKTAKEKIYAVAAKDAHRMLFEWTFLCTGDVINLYTEEELRNKRRFSSSAFDNDLVLQDEITINRTISKMVKLYREDKEFELKDIKQAENIYFIIDKFLTSRYDLCFGQTLNVKREYLEDYQILERLANKMLALMDLKVRRAMPNVEVHEEQVAQDAGIDKEFAGLFAGNVETQADSAVSTSVPEESVDKVETYRNPFASAIGMSLDDVRATRWNI